MGGWGFLSWVPWRGCRRPVDPQKLHATRGVCVWRAGLSQGSHSASGCERSETNAGELLASVEALLMRGLAPAGVCPDSPAR